MSTGQFFATRFCAFRFVTFLHKTTPQKTAGYIGVMLQGYSMSNDPPKWEVFDKHGPYIDGHDFGLLTTTGNINRFRARYRAAKSYESLSLNGISAVTELGYSALTKLFFVYSAFEPFLRVIGIKQRKVNKILCKYDVDSWVADIKSNDTDDKLFSFIVNHVNTAHKTEIGKYFKSEKFNYTYLPSSIRHTFAHGILTPNAGGCDPSQINEVSNIICDSLFEIMDREFEERMNQLERLVTAT